MKNVSRQAIYPVNRAKNTPASGMCSYFLAKSTYGNKWSLYCVLSMFVLLILINAGAQTKPKTNAKPAATKVKTAPTAKQTTQMVVKEEPEEALIPVVAEKGKEVIAVYHFTSAFGYSYDYAMSAGTAVEAGFVRSGRFTVVERNRFGIIKEEDKFKEANTSDIVNKAGKLGAKFLVTGHIIAVTNGIERGVLNVQNYVSQISIAFKLIDVATGQIEKSETILGKGTGNTRAEAMQKSYEEIDRLARAYVAEYLPQRFEYASEVEVDKKGKLQKFKIWGGSDQGLKVGDIIEIYEISFVTSPSGKKIQEKKLRGEAKVKEVNSTESSTCELLKSSTIGEQLRNDLSNKPGTIVFEYKGKVKKGWQPFN